GLPYIGFLLGRSAWLGSGPFPAQRIRFDSIPDEHRRRHLTFAHLFNQRLYIFWKAGKPCLVDRFHGGGGHELGLFWKLRTGPEFLFEVFGFEHTFAESLLVVYILNG